MFKLILMNFHQMFCSVFMFRGQMHIMRFFLPSDDMESLFPRIQWLPFVTFSSMSPPHLVLHVTNILINVAVYSVFRLKTPNKIKTMFCVNIYVEGPWTLSITSSGSWNELICEFSSFRYKLALKNISRGPNYLKLLRN